MAGRAATNRRRARLKLTEAMTELRHNEQRADSKSRSIPRIAPLLTGCACLCSPSLTGHLDRSDFAHGIFAFQVSRILSR